MQHDPCNCRDSTSHALVGAMQTLLSFASWSACIDNLIGRSNPSINFREQKLKPLIEDAACFAIIEPEESTRHSQTNDGLATRFLKVSSETHNVHVAPVPGT